MSHTDYIIIILGASLMLGMGACVAIREVNRYARPVENVLTRRGDIELGDIIEPTRPQQIYNYPDLLEPQFPIYERISYPPTYYTGPNPPFYQSGTLPYYQSVDGININSCLENSINLDFILIIIAFLVLTILGVYYLNTPSIQNIYPLFSKDISTKEITYTFKYQQIHSSKLNKGDAPFLITYGKHYKYILFAH
jgi:hypothetical protein